MLSQEDALWSMSILDPLALDDYLDDDTPDAYRKRRDVARFAEMSMSFYKTGASGKVRTTRRKHKPMSDAALAVQVTSANERAAGYKRRGVVTIRVWRLMLAHSGFRCAYCESDAHSLEHVAAMSKGGSNTLGNIAVSCLTCNLMKGSSTLDWFSAEHGLSAPAIRSRIAMAQARTLLALTDQERALCT